MKLSACYHEDTMQAVIYSDTGEVVYSAGVNDAREAQTRCMTNQDTRRILTDKLNVISVKVEWLPDGPGKKLIWENEEETLPQEEQNKITFLDLPVRLTPEQFEESAKKLILQLQDSDAAIEAEKVRHKEEMLELNKQQMNIKIRLYDVRQGNMLTRVECEIKRDFPNGTKTIIRKDTGEVVEELQMTQAEMQTEMEGMPEPTHGDTIPISVSPESETCFDVFDGKEWVETPVAKIKKDQLIRMFKPSADRSPEFVEIEGKTEFMTQTKAKKAKKTGVITISVQGTK